MTALAIRQSFAGSSGARMAEAVRKMSRPRRVKAREMRAALLDSTARGAIGAALPVDDLTQQTIILRSGLRLGFIRSA
jgi:hypothetical protein